MVLVSASCHVCFFNDTATAEIYTLSLHDALPIFTSRVFPNVLSLKALKVGGCTRPVSVTPPGWISGTGCARRISILAGILSRSEEHTSELQSRQYLACRLLLEKKTRRETLWCPVL